MNRISRFAALGLVAVFSAACAESSPTQVTDAPVSEGRFDNPAMGNKPAAAEPTIVDVAEGAGNFSILLRALETAGLDGIFEGKGQFTVFAPTDAAFGAALEELGLTAEQLLDSPDLAAILTYHVATGRRYAEDVLGSEEIRTLNGGFFFPGTDAEGAFITDANDRESRIVAADIEASNGVIHVIDTVILP